MQAPLFLGDDAKPSEAAPRSPETLTPASQTLVAALPEQVRLGTSSWSYPGWQGLVWAGAHSSAELARHGLREYAQHPLLRTVSLDRNFYRPLTPSQYAAYAAQVPPEFRFVVKAPNIVSDALIRDEQGHSQADNPHFLNAKLAVEQFANPAQAGLKQKLGVLVFQLSPLPAPLLLQKTQVYQRLAAMLSAVRAATPPPVILAVELRDAALIGPELAQLLKASGSHYALGLHAKMPPIEQQLIMLRALWPGPLICRWNLHHKHGRYGYEQAKQAYEPFNRIVDADTHTRAVLAKVARASAAAGQAVYITIGNKAEGCAPLSVVALAQAIGV